jgi:hypothetical protein
MKNPFVLILVCLGLLSFSCAITTIEEPPFKLLFDEAEFTQQKKAWNDQNIQNYRFRVWTSYIPGEDGIEHFVVKEGALPEWTVEQGPDPRKDEFYPASPDYRPCYATITGIYSYIEQAAAELGQKVEEDEELYYGASVSVSYDPDYHFPTTWHVSYGNGWVGDTDRIKVYDFLVEPISD